MDNQVEIVKHNSVGMIDVDALTDMIVDMA